MHYAQGQNSKKILGKGHTPSPVPTPTAEGDTFPQTLLPRGLRPLDRPSPTHPPPLADHFKHWVSLQLCTFVEKNWGCSSVDFYTLRHPHWQSRAQLDRQVGLRMRDRKALITRRIRRRCGSSSSPPTPYTSPC